MADRQRIGKRNKRRGTTVEYRARDWLREAGYYVVRAAGSHGAFDLVALGPRSGLAVSVKGDRAKLSDEERAEMLAVPIPPNFERQYWRIPKRARAPIIEVISH